MHQPVPIGIASFVPGLGFLLMGQRHRAAQAFAAVMLAGIFSLMLSKAFPTLYLREASWNILYFVWAIQVYLAVSTARLLQKRAQDPAKAVKGGAAAEEVEYESRAEKVRAYVARELEAGEVLLAAFEANVPTWEEKSWGRVQDPFRACYVGLTEQALLVLDVDISGVPVTVERIPRGQIGTISYKAGWRKDNLIVGIAGKDAMTMQVPAPFRKEANAFVDELDQGE